MIRHVTFGYLIGMMSSCQISCARRVFFVLVLFVSQIFSFDVAALELSDFYICVSISYSCSLYVCRNRTCEHVFMSCASGLQSDVVRFFIFFLDLFLTTMCAVSFSFVVGASVSSYGVGQVVLVMIFILMVVRTSVAETHVVLCLLEVCGPRIVFRGVCMHCGRI